MSRAKLLRHLDAMHKDAFSNCGCKGLEECNEMQAQHDQTHRILNVIVMRTSGTAVKTLFELLESKEPKEPK